MTDSLCAPYDVLLDDDSGPELRRNFDIFRREYQRILDLAYLAVMRQQHELHRQVETVEGVKWG